jgi:hypothetical protein
MFMISAIDVLRMDRSLFGEPGHDPEKSAIPRIDAMEPARASCLHHPLGTRMPQKEADDAMKPMVGTIQKGTAAVAAVFVERVGNSHDRTATQDVERPRRL